MSIAITLVTLSFFTSLSFIGAWQWSISSVAAASLSAGSSRKRAGPEPVTLQNSELTSEGSFGLVTSLTSVTTLKQT